MPQVKMTVNPPHVVACRERFIFIGLTRHMNPKAMNALSMTINPIIGLKDFHRFGLVFGSVELEG